MENMSVGVVILIVVGGGILSFIATWIIRFVKEIIIDKGEDWGYVWTSLVALPIWFIICGFVSLIFLGIKLIGVHF